MASKAIFTSIISSKAQKEIVAAWNWYEERQQSLGDRFVQEVSSKIKKIELQPEASTQRYKNYREAALSIFPYLVIYRINKRKQLIRIVSVFHTSLNPKKKLK